MQEVENLFKHKTPFNLFSAWDDLYGRFEIKGFTYRTKKIQNGSTIDIYCINNLFERVKPFVAYFISTLNTTTLRGYQYFNSVFDIDIKSFDPKYDLGFSYIKLIQLEMEYTGNNLDFGDVNFLQSGPYDTYFQKPFENHIDIHNYYEPVDLEDENEEEEEKEEYEVEITREEEEKPITVIKSFREDKCVVCLMNEPKLLFYDCLHYCVCLECEEIKPFSSCPCCRTRISTKII